MQPNFQRRLTCRVLPSSPKLGHPSSALLVEVGARRQTPPPPRFDDSWLEDFTPAGEYRISYLKEAVL